jgi:fructose-1-phosphate kinase PfkB-like protein
MARMKTKRKIKQLSENEIDTLVVAEAGDESAWSKPVKVIKSKKAPMSLPSSLAARAAFFAGLHREARLNDWLQKVIQERVDLEEAAFAGLKRELVSSARKGR